MRERYTFRGDRVLKWVSEPGGIALSHGGKSPFSGLEPGLGGSQPSGSFAF